MSTKRAADDTYGVSKAKAQKMRAEKMLAESTMGVTISEQDRADIIQWQGCSKIGKPIPGTLLIPVKTPLEGPLETKAIQDGLIKAEDSFKRTDLVKLLRDEGIEPGLIIDLVNTDKYYKGFSAGEGIEYRKIKIPGRSVPPPKDVKMVIDIIDEYLKRRPSKNHHVVVHCTHGLNRTGFFCTAYLLLRTTEGRGMSAQQAVEVFEKARGMTMDKQYLIDTLAKIVAVKPKGTK